MNAIEKLLKHHVPRESEADMYGIILYTQKNPNVRKALRDADYWEALNEISGANLAVFSVQIKEGEMGLPEIPPGMFGLMVEVWKEPAENQEILDAFEIDSSQGAPTLVLFALDEQGHLLQRSLPILEDSVESVYASLKESLSLVAKTISGIKSDNLKNTYGVQAAVNLALDNERDWKRLKKALRFWVWLKGAAS